MTITIQKQRLELANAEVEFYKALAEMQHSAIKYTLDSKNPNNAILALAYERYIKYTSVEAPTNTQESK